MRTVLAWLGGLIAICAIVAAGYAGYQAVQYDNSMSHVYRVEVPPIQRSTDPAVLARGQHLAESIGRCLECHGERLEGLELEDFGPIAKVNSPNITRGRGGVLHRYSDGQLARLILHGIKSDGHSVRFMPSDQFSWWPLEDVAALISWLRIQPPIDHESEPTRVGVLGKVLDRVDIFRLDTARRVDHSAREHQPPAPAATPEYGAFLSKLCVSCHGPGLSGGPIPGAPPDLPVPANLTPHATGLANYTLADLEKVLRTGIKPDGSKLDPFMPIDAWQNMNDTEVEALFAYLKSLPPTPFGRR